MFSNYESEVVGFSSSWKMEKTTSDGESQTTEFSTSENGTSTCPARSVAAQTEPVVQAIGPPRPATPPGLAAWLQGIAPLVFKELRISDSSTVFKGYNPYTDDGEGDTRARLLQIIQTMKDGDFTGPKEEVSDPIHKVPIVSLSWSCTGNTLAAGTGHLYHEDWCQHDGTLLIYTSDRTDEMKLSNELKLAACASAVSFHSSEPALLATATISGVISVWNLQHQDLGRDPLVSSLSAHSGRSITALQWLSHVGGSSHDKLLASAGSDGKVIFWLANLSSNSLTQQTCYEICGSSTSFSKLPPDISCMDFARTYENKLKSEACDGMTHDYFAVGCRTGQVIVCRMSSAKSIAVSSSLDPLVSTPEPHTGAVLCLFFCSQHARIFLTLGADKEIRMYDVLQVPPVRVIHCDNSLSIVKWVPNDSKALLLAAMMHAHQGKTPTLQVFSVTSGQEIKVEGLQDLETVVSGKLATVSSCGITNFCFNNKNINCVACGDMEGNIQIWNVPFQDILVPDDLESSIN